MNSENIKPKRFSLNHIRQFVGGLFFQKSELPIINLQEENLILSQRILPNTNEAIKEQKQRHYSPLYLRDSKFIYYSVESSSEGKTIIISQLLYDFREADIDNIQENSYKIMPIWEIYFSYSDRKYRIHSHIANHKLTDKDINQLLKKITRNQEQEMKKQKWNDGDKTAGTLISPYLIDD